MANGYCQKNPESSSRLHVRMICEKQKYADCALSLFAVRYRYILSRVSRFVFNKKIWALDSQNLYTTTL